MDQAGTLETLYAAVAIFVGGHFVLSSLAVRRPIIAAMGAGLFRLLYSGLSIAALVWAVKAYNAAPVETLWLAPVALFYLPHILMLPACILIVAGTTTRSPTAIGGEAVLVNDPKPSAGILTVTRHPLLVGIALWAAGHAAVTGDLASLALFGGLFALALGGMAHIDHRRQASAGSDWGPIALSTSRIPFLAALQGRTKVDWRGIGMARTIGGVALYGVLALAHEWIAGVSLIG